MEKFTRLKSIAAPLAIDNVDTDMIIPKEFLKTVEKKGLGQHLFDELRRDIDGKSKGFVLDTPPFDKAQILVSLENFGCGSSREHAPWALKDFGIRVVIAKSFADIFNNNCTKNGILTIKTNDENINKLIKYLENSTEVDIDLQAQKVSFGSDSFNFDIDNFNKETLLNGLDDIALTLKHKEKIEEYEKNRRLAWV